MRERSKLPVRILFLFLTMVAAFLTISGGLFARDAEAGYTVEPADKKGANGFPREYRVRYGFDPRLKVLAVGVTNVDFSKVSILLKVESIGDNTAVLLIQSFELSNFIIPALPVRVADGVVTDTVLTREVPVEQMPLQPAVSNAAPMEDIYDIFDPTVLIIAILSVLLLGLTALLVYRVFFLKKKSSITTGNLVDPYEEAIKSLNRLQRFMNDKNPKEIYLGIWETVRRFLDRVYGFPALEMSTSEIFHHFHAMSSVGADGMEEIQDIALHILRICDRVKYAKFNPETGQKEAILKDSFDLVRRTREHFDLLRAETEADAAAVKQGTEGNR